MGPLPDRRAVRGPRPQPWRKAHGRNPRPHRPDPGRGRPARLLDLRPPATRRSDDERLSTPLGLAAADAAAVASAATSGIMLGAMFSNTSPSMAATMAAFQPGVDGSSACSLAPTMRPVLRGANRTHSAQTADSQAPEKESIASHTTGPTSLLTPARTIQKHTAGHNGFMLCAELPRESARRAEAWVACARRGCRSTVRGSAERHTGGARMR